MLKLRRLLVYNLQKKTREHLIQLLPLCGHKGALKASHSVTFSSSSDLAVESKQAASSGEASGDEQADIDETGFSGRQVSAHRLLNLVQTRRKNHRRVGDCPASYVFQDKCGHVSISFPQRRQLPCQLEMGSI